MAKFQHFALCFAFLGLSYCGKPWVYEPAPAPLSLDVQVDVPTGQVGHNMVFGARFLNCGRPGHLEGLSIIAGSLPADLRVNEINITGIPRTPGTYYFTVRIHRPECKGRIYSDIDVPVRLNIEGDAARRIPKTQD